MLIDPAQPAARRNHRQLRRCLAARSAATTKLPMVPASSRLRRRSEEHTSELQSQSNPACRLLLEKKKEPGPRGAFVEKRREVPAFETSGPFLTGGDRDLLACCPQNEMDVGRMEVANREDASPPEA